MKKLLFVSLVIILASILVFGGCAEPEPEPAPTPAPEPAPSPEPAPEPEPGGPEYGGEIKIIANAGPNVLGGSLEQGPFDLFVLLGGVEKLVEYNENQELVPWLAKSVDVDEAASTITIGLREGAKWHDGSDIDAESIAWNYNFQVQNERIGYLYQFESVEVVDKYTLVINYTGGYNNQLIMGWLWSPPMWSKAAWEAAGGGEASMEWARGNFSASGPFKLSEFARDDHLTLVRNDDYWGPKPYLDSITYRFIPDSVTAGALMEAGQADWWLQPPPNKQIELEEAGLVRQSGGGTMNCLIPNIAAPESKWTNPKLRQAVQVALDKAAMAKALGFGLASPLLTIAPEGAMGYDPAYEGHPYNPDRARELLAEAGYPDGVKIKLLALQGPATIDNTEAIKSYLDAVGIETEIDIADAGRYYGSLYGMGWEDLILSGAGILGDVLGTFHTNFGDQPLTSMAPASWMVPQELLDLSVDSRTYSSRADQATATEKIVQYLSDEALIIPIYLQPSAYVVQPWVHTDYLAEGGFTFYFGKYWMEAQ